MSKAVLISIRPEWCETIINGQKTIEVRKTLQILDHLPGGNLDDSRNVLTDNATRAQLGDNSEHLRPEVSIIPYALLLSSHGEWLAGESAGNNVNCS